jgi:hypothetical protein
MFLDRVLGLPFRMSLQSFAASCSAEKFLVVVRRIQRFFRAA